MSSNSFFLLLFLAQLVILYFVSRQTIKELFIFFRRFMPERAVAVLITILFLPGTIMHELAHFIMAISLMLRVREVSILPEFDDDYIKLGKVVYEKKDIVRGILVGIAPIFAGLFLFWMASSWQLFPAPSFLLSVVMGYSIFVISTTMFSSKQDLVDMIYIVPLAVILIAVLYIFSIDVGSFIPPIFWNHLRTFINNLNFYFFFSFIIHIGIIVLLKILKKILR
ncbi:MAG: hypothetical protein ABIO02_04330 [Patescibacteria group bacterium]